MISKIPEKVTCGEHRTMVIEERVTRAIKLMTNEIDANEGLYPYNGGAITKNEIIRRAGIGKTTLFSKTQVLLNAHVDDWLFKLKSKHHTSRGEIRASHAERAAAWKGKYESLAAAHHLSELELQQHRAEVYELKRSLSALQKLYNKNFAELQSLRNSNVVNIRPN